MSGHRLSEKSSTPAAVAILYSVGTISLVEQIQDVRIVCFERPLDGGQEIRRRAGDGVTGNGQLPIDVVARFGHRNAEPERRQFARRRRIGAGLRQYRNSREVDVETGEIPDWIVRQLARLPGEWG